MPKDAQGSQPSVSRMTRNRKSHSCTECRRRKKHCDRIVPGCNQCTLRGTAHLCRWGDERDGDENSVIEDESQVDAVARSAGYQAEQRNSEAFHPYSDARWSTDQGRDAPAMIERESSTVYPAAENPSALRVRQLLSKDYDRSALIAELADADKELGNRDGAMHTHRSSPSSSSAQFQSSFGVQSFSNAPSSSYSMTSPGSTTSLSIPPLAASVFRGQHGTKEFPTTSNGAKSLLNLEQAMNLYRHYDELVPEKILVIDDAAIRAAFDRSASEGVCKDLSDIRHRQPDVYALILLVCASTALLLPPSYSITMGLLTRYQDLHTFVGDLEEEAERTLVAAVKVPTLLYIQCGTLYLHNLAQRAGAQSHVSRIDRYIRAARRMGLDRLGSPQDDEALWQQEDNNVGGSCRQACVSQGRTCQYGLCFETQGTSMTIFAADTLRRRDRKARNMGRVHWSFLAAKDWVAARLSGCYTIHPASYTTTLPGPYSVPSDDTVTEKVATVWQFCWVGAETCRLYNDLTADAESKGSAIDYDKILEIDRMIVAALDARPDWLCPELDSKGRTRTRQEQFDALLVSCTLWHRLFVIHRPFLMFSQTHPQRYGASASRSWDYARLTVKMTREAWQTSTSLTKMLPMHFRLLQAALVIISHLFLWPQEPSLTETVEIHEDLHFVIHSLSTVHKQGSMSIFAGQSERLEALLAAAARIKRTQTRAGAASHDGTTALPPWMRPSTVPCQTNSGGSYASHAIPPSSLPLHGQQGSQNKNSELLGTLDEQLLRLMGESGLPAQLQQSDDELWSEIFTFLDANAMYTPNATS